MAATGKKILADLKTAAGTFDRARARELSGQLIEALATKPEPCSARDAKKILALLRSQRWFELMEEVARALLAAGVAPPNIRRQLAQSLIDGGDLVGAQETLAALLRDLDGLLESTPGDRRLVRERSETRGLMGRLHKQSYVDAAASHKRVPAALTRAVTAYLEAYRRDSEQIWHGINAVACALRAERDGVPLTPPVDARKIAGQILELIEDRDADGGADAWDCATAMEACLALDRDESAVEWMARYLAANASAFALGSTLRQLEEIWQLLPSEPPGSNLLPMLRAKTLDQDGGSVEVRPRDVAAGPGPMETHRGSYEKVHGIGARFVEIEWWRTGESRCQAVAQISEVLGSGQGTGFLLRGKDLHPSLGEEVLLLTNAHVVSDDEAVHRRLAQPPLYSEDAKVTFQVGALAKGSWSVGEILFSSPPWELDATLMRLDPPLDPDPEATPRCPISFRKLPLGGTERLYIIGHPAGGTLKFSLEDNVLLDYERTRSDGWRGLIHYRTPTEGGSSGSPVFNKKWQLVALHHAGYDECPRLNGTEGIYAANEGILLRAIRDRLDSGVS